MPTKCRYDFDDVRRAISAERVAELFGGCRIVNHRCAAIWRNGDNPESVQFNDDGTFKDHKTGEHGGPMALLALIRGISIQEAAEELGDRYCPQLARETTTRRTRKARPAMVITAPALVTPIEPGDVPPPAEIPQDLPPMPPPAATKYDQLIADGWQVVREYPYTEADGTWCYTVMRLEKDGEKTFLQKTPDGWGLKGVRRILYNLPEVVKASEVWIVEGEKDVETLRDRNIVATTNSGGAEHWEESFSSELRGKDIIICMDNDDKGRAHVMAICRSVFPVAASVKLICPSGESKGDVTDYLQGGIHTVADLRGIAAAVPLWKPERPGVVTPEMKAEAKELNKKPFKNFRIIEATKPGEKETIEPLALNTMLAEFFRRFLQFPYRLGLDTLFDHDKDTREIETIPNDDALFAWISRKSGQNYQWMSDNRRGFISKKEFFNAIKQTAKRFEMVSYVPNYPEQPNIYYTYPPLPPPSEKYICFRRLCDFFAPAADWHRAMIRTLFAAPLWYRQMFGRPSWIIDSSEGKGVGKTTLIEILSHLYMCEPLDISVEQVFRHYEEIIKRLVSEGGRKTRIVLLDNLTVDLSCGQFASLITKSSITGRAPYSSGEDTRPNNLTYCITSNSAQVDDDLVSRSFFISLRRPEANGNWKRDILDYIDKNRWQIFSDIIDIIQRHHPYDTPPKTRYPEFEQEVMQPMCGDPVTYQQVLENMQQAKEAANIEQDRANQITDGIRWKLAEVNNSMQPANRCYWIQSDVFKKWAHEILGMQVTAPTVRNYARNGLTRNFDPLLERFPTSTADPLRRSGIMWVGESSQGEAAASIIGMKSGKITYIDQKPYERH
jgi:hypothetical protein